MIEVAGGVLHRRMVECILRPIRSDLAPVTPASRDLAVAAGPKLQERLEAMGMVPVGGAVMTPGGDLPADFVIHVVVSAPDEPETTLTVQKALRNGLRRAADFGVESLALPPLGLGVGRVEAEDSARVMLDILYNHLDEGAPPSELHIVVAHDYEVDVFRRLVAEYDRAR